MLDKRSGRPSHGTQTYPQLERAQLAHTRSFPLGLFAALTVLPALAMGGAIWYFAGTLPGCSTQIAERLPSPDGQFDLVVFSRSCGASTGPNTQAALIPSGEDLPEDAASFFSVGAQGALAPRWDGFDNIELSVPPASQIYRQDDTVAGVSVIYR